MIDTIALIYVESLCVNITDVLVLYHCITVYMMIIDHMHSWSYYNQHIMNMITTVPQDTTPLGQKLS